MFKQFNDTFNNKWRANSLISIVKKIFVMCVDILFIYIYIRDTETNKLIYFTTIQ